MQNIADIIRWDFEKKQTLFLLDSTGTVQYSEHKDGTKALSILKRTNNKTVKISYNCLQTDEWHKWVYNNYGFCIEYSRSNGYWYKQKTDLAGKELSFENSNGVIR